MSARKHLSQSRRSQPHKVCTKETKKHLLIGEDLVRPSPPRGSSFLTVVRSVPCSARRAFLESLHIESTKARYTVGFDVSKLCRMSQFSAFDSWTVCAWKQAGQDLVGRRCLTGGRMVSAGLLLHIMGPVQPRWWAYAVLVASPASK